MLIQNVQFVIQSVDIANFTINKMMILTSSGVISAKVKKSQARNIVYLNGETTPKIMILPWTDLIHFKIRTLPARNDIDLNGETTKKSLAK